MSRQAKHVVGGTALTYPQYQNRFFEQTLFGRGMLTMPTGKPSGFDVVLRACWAAGKAIAQAEAEVADAAWGPVGGD